MISKKVLEKYIEEDLTLKEISISSGYGITTIARYLKKYDLYTSKSKHSKRIKNKICYKCGEKDISKFEPNRFNECKSCRCEFQKELKRQRKIDLVNYKGGKCEKCGYNKCYAVLSFHHRNPSEKSFTICNVSKSLAKLKTEADKCDLLCSNCHLETHYLQKEMMRNNRV